VPPNPEDNWHGLPMDSPLAFHHMPLYAKGQEVFESINKGPA
jgi:hypothetical protein